jgi:photosystem II stability/assembly factor-like uncharacterized protein
MSEVVTVTGAAPANAVEPSAVVEIRSPNDAVRWRIVRGGQVERTETAGAQWQLLTMPLGVRLIAGHSPAPTIAWFVGAAGGVYRTADGSFVTRLPFPEAIDLVSVVGVDEREATVTTADGRRFRTVDAGATWVSQ